MDIYQALQLGEYFFNYPQSYLLKSEKDLGNVDAECIESLRVNFDFKGKIPELSHFPKLKRFSCTAPLDSSYINRQDFSQIRQASLSCVNMPGTIHIEAPLMNRLNIHIYGNDDSQISLFNMGNRLIELCNMSSLEELRVGHCTGYTMCIDRQYPHMKKFAAVYCENEFEILAEKFPRLESLSLDCCGQPSIEFLGALRDLTTVSLDSCSITDASVLFQLPKLQKIHLFRNPLSDQMMDKIRMLSCKRIIITRKDNEAEVFRSGLQGEIASAYRSMRSMRETTVHYPRFVQDRIVESTDTELFLNCLTRNVKSKRDRYLDSSKNFRSPELTYQELTEIIYQELPFLEGLLEE